MSRALREEVVLRSVIRDILREAPYRGSSPVRLGAVQSPGMSVKQIISAVGFTAMSSAYTWMADFCTGKNETYPIKQSGVAQERLIKAKKNASDTLENQGAAYSDYRDSLAQDNTRPAGQVATSAGGLITAASSDLANAQGLYGLVRLAATKWPQNSAPLINDVNDVSGKPAIYGHVADVLERYTNCERSVVEQKLGAKDKMAAEFPLKTRDEYIQFMKNITENTHVTFQDGVEKQRQKIRSYYNTAPDVAKIDKFCNDTKKLEESIYKAAFATIK